MQTFLQDLRYGARLLRKSPGFTLIAVLTLGLGIGVNTTIFSYGNMLLYRILTFPEPERVTYIWSANAARSEEQQLVSGPDFLDWRAQAESFAGLAAAAAGTRALTGAGDPERISSARVTTNFLQVFGITPSAGRAFVADEAKPGAARVVLLGHQFWQTRFAGDPRVLQQTITLDGQAHTIIGIMPPDFRYVWQGDVWEPLAPDAANAEFAERGRRWLTVFGRLKPGVTVAQAQAELDNLTRRSAEQFPAANAGWGARVMSTQDALTGPQTRIMLFLLLGVVFTVLLIACANVANLQLARAAARRKEIAMRLALGAGRGRLVRQLLTESLLLALLGGALGVVLAYWCKALINARFIAAIPLLNVAALDYRVLAYTLLLTLLAALFFGLAPALQASRTELTDALKEGGRGGSGGGTRTRKTLVIAQMALALSLLIIAGLMMRTIIAYQRIEPGFEANNLLVMRVSLPEREYASDAQTTDFFARVLPQIAAQPGNQAAAAITQLPLAGDLRGARHALAIEGRPAANDNDKPWAVELIATPGYFACLGIPLQRGRQLASTDQAGTLPVAVISQTMARKYWPEEDPIGQRFKFEQATTDGWLNIVGVVGDVRNNSLGAAPLPQVYLPHAQHPAREMALVVRTAGDPLQQLAAVRAGVRAVDRNLPVYQVYTMQQLFFLSLSETLIFVELLGAFGVLALVLAAVGIYGVTAYAVVQRTPEIGLRMALGAQARDVLQLVLRQGMKLAGLGVALGLLLALGLAQLLQSLFYGVSTTDPLTFAGLALLLLGVAWLACWIPARRATKVDPLIALRSE